jgi:hypothetical protein
MAIITRGSMDQFSVEPTYAGVTSLAGADQVDSFGALSEVTREAPAGLFRFAVSPENRGLAVASLRLDKEFRSYLARLLKQSSDIYFLAWCWDLSGSPASTYPGLAASPTSSLIPIGKGETREFIGSGAVLFPARPVTAGLALRIQIWESAHRARDFGRTLASVAAAIQQSKLNSLLTLIGTATGVATATVALVEQASLELAKTVGDILKASSDDHVDFYEGYFPASEPWLDGVDLCKGHASEIGLNRFR